MADKIRARAGFVLTTRKMYPIRTRAVIKCGCTGCTRPSYACYPFSYGSSFTFDCSTTDETKGVDLCGNGGGAVSGSRLIRTPPTAASIKLDSQLCSGGVIDVSLTVEDFMEREPDISDHLTPALQRWKYEHDQKDGVKVKLLSIGLDHLWGHSTELITALRWYKPQKIDLGHKNPGTS